VWLGYETTSSGFMAAHINSFVGDGVWSASQCILYKCITETKGGGVYQSSVHTQMRMHRQNVRAHNIRHTFYTVHIVDTEWVDVDRR
jgi:hypothetical protein